MNLKPVKLSALTYPLSNFLLFVWLSETNSLQRLLLRSTAHAPGVWWGWWMWAYLFPPARWWCSWGKWMRHLVRNSPILGERCCCQGNFIYQFRNFVTHFFISNSIFCVRSSVSNDFLKGLFLSQSIFSSVLGWSYYQLYSKNPNKRPPLFLLGPPPLI